MAGIAAAKTLHERGFHNFLIIEGEDRVGGRVKTSAFGGTHVETGAHWIHSYEGNPLHELTKKVGVRGKQTDYHCFTFRDDNSNNVTEQTLTLYEKYVDVVQKVKNMSTSISEHDGSDMSLKNAFKMHGWKSTSPIALAIEHFELEFMSGYTLETTSLKVDGDFDIFTIDGEKDLHLGFPDGYSTLMNRMVSDFLLVNDSRLKLNEAVNSITYDENSVSVQTKAGNTYRGDFALATFGIGVLQHDYIQFNPPMPEWKKQVIFKQHISQYSSVYLKWPSSMTPFWDDTEFIVYTTGHKGYYSVWHNLQAAGFYPNGTNILEVSITGTEAERIHTLTDEQILDEATEVLQNMYGKHIPKPTEIHFERWLTNPFYYGAFAYRSYGHIEGDIEALGAPLGNLFFGGEAHAEYTGFVHGAYLNGIQRANEILKCLHKCIDGSGCSNY